MATGNMGSLKSTFVNQIKYFGSNTTHSNLYYS